MIKFNLSDLANVMKAATLVLERYPYVDCLINNAGVMSLTRQNSRWLRINVWYELFRTLYANAYIIWFNYE